MEAIRLKNMTDISLFVFVFTKDKKIKVLNSLDTAHNKAKLILEGWTHTATLADSCAFIQYLHNECEDIDRVYEIECLSNPKI